ncbi:hypothetical protein AVEN_140555-1 [Araneus ventricosus]|uniref:Uncharacterized protein n=1 Tax=Araneus ventricosus TaxID=182803 RepID=A0A4Y2ITQ3_ARAVE|nr:hypothetical protein AVEN_140555-1 [Araneus ventricosus]
MFLYEAQDVMDTCLRENESKSPAEPPLLKFAQVRCCMTMTVLASYQATSAMTSFRGANRYTALFVAGSRLADRPPFGDPYWLEERRLDEHSALATKCEDRRSN